MSTSKKQMHVYVQPDIFELLREKAHEHRTSVSRIVETCVEEILGMNPGESFDDWCSKVDAKRDGGAR